MASDMQVRESVKDGRYQFTEDEKRALKECRFESFWYRAFPLAAASGFSTHVMVQRGLLSASQRFGSIPKVVFGTICGYALGKMLYVQQCREKFLKLENSPFAEMIRRGKVGMPSSTGFGETTAYGGGDVMADDPLQQETPWSGMPDNHSNLDIDVSRDEVKGLDSTFDSDVQRGEDKDTAKPEMTMTYDELRKRTREKNSQQYTQVLPGHYQPNPGASTVAPQPDQQARPQRRPQPQDEFMLGTRNRNKSVNQYGDVWEKE